MSFIMATALCRLYNIFKTGGLLGISGKNYHIFAKMSLAQVLKSIEDNAIEFVRFEQTDLYGIARSKTIPARHFRKKATEGLNFFLGHLSFDPMAQFIQGTGYLEEIGFADGVCFPDYDTFTVLPWCENTGRILIEPTFRGEPVASHPRIVAKKQLHQLKELGISLLSAHEHEFYLMHRDTKKLVNSDHNIRSTLRNNEDMKFTNQIMRQLPQVGVDIECAESEYGPGQQEISYIPAFGIRAADNAHTYKTSIKEIARHHNYTAVFMTKPWPDEVGGASHFCHSLWDVEGKKPLLYDPNEPTGLSETAQHWMAGILTHAPAIGVLMAPTVNCVTRYQLNSWAPYNATWGHDNRSCFLRVKVNGAKNTYIENRAGASGCNPYLSLAATVAAGIDGIQRKLTLPADVTGSAYDEKEIPPGTALIPNKMKDALKAFLDDDVITRALGEEFVKVFTAAKVHEMKLEEEALAKGDKDWEQKLYFEYI